MNPSRRTTPRILSVLLLAGAATAAERPGRSELPVWGMTVAEAKAGLAALEAFARDLVDHPAPTRAGEQLRRGAKLRDWLAHKLATAPADAAPGSLPAALLEIHELHVLGILWEEMERRFVPTAELLFRTGLEASHSMVFDSLNTLRRSGASYQGLVRSARAASGIYLEEPLPEDSVKAVQEILVGQLAPAVTKAMDAFDDGEVPDLTADLDRDAWALRELGECLLKLGDRISPLGLPELARVYSIHGRNLVERFRERIYALRDRAAKDRERVRSRPGGVQVPGRMDAVALKWATPKEKFEDAVARGRARMAGATAEAAKARGDLKEYLRLRKLEAARKSGGGMIMADIYHWNLVPDWAADFALEAKKGDPVLQYEIGHRLWKLDEPGFSHAPCVALVFLEEAAKAGHPEAPAALDAARAQYRAANVICTPIR